MPRPRILLMDDLPENLRLLQRLLGPLDYSVSTAPTAEQALEHVRRSVPSSSSPTSSSQE